MDQVTMEEYLQHKHKCGNSFEAVISRIDRLDRAVYGDKENAEIGMKDQMNQIYGFFFSTNVVIKAVKHGFIVISFVSALIYGLVKLWKEFK